MHPNTPTTRTRVARSAILAAAILTAISFPTGDVAGWRRPRFWRSAISRRDLQDQAAHGNGSMRRMEASCQK
jgi:hypothetical protein